MTEGENCYKELRSAGTAKKEILIPGFIIPDGWMGLEEKSVSLLR